jgi:hypothetical protein
MVLVTSGSGRPCEGLRCAVVSLPSSAGVPVVWSFLYLALRHVLELIMLCCRSTDVWVPRTRAPYATLANSWNSSVQVNDRTAVASAYAARRVGVEEPTNRLAVAFAELALVV